MKKSYLFLFFALFVFSLTAQENNQRISVFIDCQMRCDFTYIKQEITFVDYMQDRFTADVYILANRQRTGSGGDEITLNIQGNKTYSHLQDTLIYILSPDATDAIAREDFVKRLKQVLLPYLAISPNASNIEYKIETPENDNSEESVINDSWNYWVMNVGGNANIRGEASFGNISLGARFSASRVTEANKFFLSTRYNYRKSKFTLSDGEEIINTIESYSNFVRYVVSLNDHWSAGFDASQGSSTFGNTDIEGAFRPAIEYNVYPYSESATRRFSILYAIGPEYKDYTEETVFNKLDETIVRQRLSLEFSQTQKWGELSVDARFSQYMHDLNLFSVSINPDIEWNIVKGLRIEFGGFASWVGDRINIAQSDLTDEEILLQIKQLDTDYEFFSYIGLNYRFGSKYNNFVNPRF